MPQDGGGPEHHSPKRDPNPLFRYESVQGGRTVSVTVGQRTFVVLLLIVGGWFGLSVLDADATRIAGWPLRMDRLIE